MLTLAPDSRATSPLHPMLILFFRGRVLAIANKQKSNGLLTSNGLNH
jgi:hypothetical protein